MRRLRQSWKQEGSPPVRNIWVFMRHSVSKSNKGITLTYNIWSRRWCWRTWVRNHWRVQRCLGSPIGRLALDFIQQRILSNTKIWYCNILTRTTWVFVDLLRKIDLSWRGGDVSRWLHTPSGLLSVCRVILGISRVFFWADKKQRCRIPPPIHWQCPFLLQNTKT